MDVFRTKKGSYSPVEISGVGVLDPNGVGGIPIERAARSMSELQQKVDGKVQRDKNNQPIQLTGAALKQAAQDFADRRGLEVVSITGKEIQAEHGGMGAAHARASAEKSHARVHGGGADPFNAKPAAQDTPDLLGEPDAAEEGDK